MFACQSLVVIALTLVFAPLPAEAEEKPVADAADAAKKIIGNTPAMEALGDLAVMHEERIKPLDTMARQEMKQIHGSERLKLAGSDAGAENAAETWNPTAAMLDWMFRPEEWDNREFILIEYLPLKRKLLANDIKRALEPLAGNVTEAQPLLDDPNNVTAKGLLALAAKPNVSQEQRKALENVARLLGEDHKWMSPDQLENAKIVVNDKEQSFSEWCRSLMSAEEGGMNSTRPMIEKKALEVFRRLFRYQSIRDRMHNRGVRFLIMPRPCNAAAVAFGAASVKHLEDSRTQGAPGSTSSGLSLYEEDTLFNLQAFYRQIQDKKRQNLGTNEEFDERFTSWLREKSWWVPLKIFLGMSSSDLERAGYPVKETGEFVAAWKKMESDLSQGPDGLSLEDAQAVVLSARTLGTAAGSYPTTNLMALETHYNRFAPFFKAPWAFGTALVLLILSMVSLGIRSDRSVIAPIFGKATYQLGMLAFLGGIVLEVYGFYLRFHISTWGLVTNMYETVIWVALVTSVLGFVFELIYRKTYPALAATGVALAATILAANVSLLDPAIPSLEPVLRSRYWLTVHVLTIVSSYAAFSLAMGLGLIAATMYVTAAYRRAVNYAEIAWPAAIGIPCLVVGAFIVRNSAAEWDNPASSQAPYFLGGGLGIFGGFVTVAVLTALIGEWVSRRTFVPSSAGNDAQDRAVAMNATAGRIKPVANFIYRAMQVGVLLVTIGTILGGVWADLSWGRFWGWDPKEVWALITLLTYLVPLHGRFAGWIGNFGLVVASVVCFSSVLMAWYGVNFVLGVGLHSYGFVEGGGQMTVAATSAMIVGFIAGTWWRRHLSYHVAESAAAALSAPAAKA